MAPSSNSVRRDDCGPNALVVRLVALVIGILSILCLVHGLRAGISNVLYFKAKFGRDRDSLERVVEHCESAWKLYPFNYYFAIWTAEKAYYEWESGKTDNGRLETARQWCERGLALNGYRSSLRLLKTRLLRLDSLDQAISYWETYVNWNFWNPHNHAVLSELYAASGRWGMAMKELQWTRGSDYHEHTRKVLNTLWNEQMKPPE